MKNTLKITLCITIILLMGQCKKPKPLPTNTYKPYSLPPISSEGCGTFGCLKDGEFWNPDGYKPRSTSEYYRYGAPNPALSGNFDMNATSKLESVTFAKTNLWDTGMYRLRNTEHLPHTRNIFDNGYIYISHIGSYQSDSTTYGWVHIHHLDTIKRIISGTFEYDAINRKKITDTIKIRKGRFDHKY